MPDMDSVLIVLQRLDLASILNLLGLALITLGSIFAALASPQPQYGADGSVSMSNLKDIEKRIRMHKMQKRFPNFLKMVALGAVLQAIAVFLPLLQVPTN